MALALAKQMSDDAVMVAALRTRQLALSGPEHVAFKQAGLGTGPQTTYVAFNTDNASIPKTLH